MHIHWAEHTAYAYTHIFMFEFGCQRCSSYEKKSVNRDQRREKMSYEEHEQEKHIEMQCRKREKRPQAESNSLIKFTAFVIYLLHTHYTAREMCHLNFRCCCCIDLTRDSLYQLHFKLFGVINQNEEEDAGKEREGKTTNWIEKNGMMQWMDEQMLESIGRVHTFNRSHESWRVVWI